MAEQRRLTALTIAERVANGECVEFSNWSNSRENDYRIALAFFPLFLLVGVLAPDPRFRIFAYISPIWLLMLWSMHKTRKKSRGAGLVISSDAVEVRSGGAPPHCIAWQNLDGVTVTKRGVKLFTKDGGEHLVEGLLYSPDMPLGSRHVIHFLSERSQFFHDRRDVESPPQPKSSLRARLWTGVVLTMIGMTGVILLIPDLSNTNVTAQQVWRTVYMQAGLAVVWGGGMYIAVVNWYRLDLYNRPYLWDRSVPFPLSQGYTAEQHRRMHRGHPPKIELEPGKTYIHMGGNTEAASLRFTVWVGPIMGAVFLLTPLWLMLDEKKPALGAVVILLCLGVPVSLLMGTVAYWYAQTVGPFVSKFRLEGGKLFVECRGEVRSYPYRIVRERRSWLTPSQFGFCWEEIGDERGSVLLDRRYLRRLDENELFNRR